MRKLNLDILADAVLLKLYKHAAKYGGRLSIDEISASFQITVTSTFLNEVLLRLSRKDLLYHAPNRRLPYEINGDGIEYVQQQLKDSSSWIFKLDEAGDDWLEGPEDDLSKTQRELDPALGTVSMPESIPAADRTVSLDHNSSDYEASVAALNEAIREFREDQKFGNQFRAEKHALIKTLEAGRELLENTQVQINVAIAMTIEPLKIVAKKYESELIASSVTVALTTAITLLLRLFGIG